MPVNRSRTPNLNEQRPRRSRALLVAAGLPRAIETTERPLFFPDIAFTSVRITVV
jgi:hypothetical protein